jgi:hypothetical protein
MPLKKEDYWHAAEKELLSQVTRAPWIGSRDMFKDTRWVAVNPAPYTYLEYEPLDVMPDETDD